MAGESDSDLACSRRVTDWLPAGALAGVPLDIQLQPGAASRARLFAPSGECGECIRPRAGGTTHSAARSCLVYIGALVVARRSVLRSSAGLGGGIVWEAATILTRFLVQSGAPYLPGERGRAGARTSSSSGAARAPAASWRLVVVIARALRCMGTRGTCVTHSHRTCTCTSMHPDTLTRTRPLACACVLVTPRTGSPVALRAGDRDRHWLPAAAPGEEHRGQHSCARGCRVPPPCLRHPGGHSPP